MFMEGLIRLVQKGHTCCQTGIERRYLPAAPCEWWDLWDGGLAGGRVGARSSASHAESRRPFDQRSDARIRPSRERRRIESRCRRPVPDGDLNTEDGRSSDFVRSTFPTISSVAEAITLF